MKVLYEDNQIIAVVKPFNMPSQKDRSGDRDILDEVKDYLREEYHKPGAVFAGLVSRLDRPAGGVMVIARTSKAAKRLSAAFAAHTDVAKQYLAVAAGPGLPDAGKLTDWLLKDPRTNTVRIVASGAPGAKEARLSYQVLSRIRQRSLVLVRLETGRPHQIRVQFAGAGHPLLGDQRYNPAAARGQQLALWSWSLTITHPVTRERQTFTELPPAKPPWSDFPVERLLSQAKTS